MRSRLGMMIVLACSVLSACSSLNSLDVERVEYVRDPRNPDRLVEKTEAIEQDRLFGKGGLSLLGGDDKAEGQAQHVNAYLWGAAVDRLSFIGFEQVQPDIGLLVSNWYLTEDKPNLRTQFTVRILNQALLSQSLNVQIVRQKYNPANQQWLIVQPPEALQRETQMAILQRARDLKTASTQILAVK